MIGRGGDSEGKGRFGHLVLGIIDTETPRGERDSGEDHALSVGHDELGAPKGHPREGSVSMPGLQLHRCPLCSTRCWTSWLGALAFVFPSLVRPSQPSEQI